MSIQNQEVLKQVDGYHFILETIGYLVEVSVDALLYDQCCEQHEFDPGTGQQKN